MRVLSFGVLANVHKHGFYFAEVTWLRLALAWHGSHLVFVLVWAASVHYGGSADSEEGQQWQSRENHLWRKGQWPPGDAKDLLQKNLFFLFHWCWRYFTITLCAGVAPNWGEVIRLRAPGVLQRGQRLIGEACPDFTLINTVTTSQYISQMFTNSFPCNLNAA